MERQSVGSKADAGRIEHRITADSDKILTQFNATTTPYPAASLVHEIFESHTEIVPEAPAVVLTNQSFTYREINERANRVAHALLDRGVRPDSLVAVLAERGIDALIAYLGILKAGGAYVPLDSHYPRDRLAFMLEDSKPVVLLRAHSDKHADTHFNVPTMKLETLRAHSSHNPTVPGLTSRNLAYVVYTSASHGQPKGVMIEHRGILRLICNTDYAAIDSHDCVAHCASPSFDASTWEIWAALLNGARLLIIPHRVLMNPHQFNRMLIQHSVTTLRLTVGLFNEYVDHLEAAFSGLKHLITGGDVLDARRAARVLNKAAPPRNLINAYGPTETTTFATTINLSTSTQPPSATRIGRPIANTKIYIQSDEGELCPIGIPGEICIGGPGVARGYLNQPLLTATRFIPDLYSTDAVGQRLYRTGDIGRWLPDGTIDYMGRRDCQVKIRGFRVEPGEVEEALRRSTRVRQALVVAREGPEGQKQLIAYIVQERTTAEQAARNAGEVGACSKDAHKSLLRELRNHLSASLPSFMIPSAIVSLPSLPLNENGNVDRAALPPPTLDAFVCEDYVEPQGPVEQALASLWQEVLGVERVGRNDNFLELGGNSISAMKLTLAIERRFAVSLQAQNVLAAGTFGDVATFVESLLRAAGGSHSSTNAGDLTMK